MAKKSALEGLRREQANAARDWRQTVGFVGIALGVVVLLVGLGQAAAVLRDAQRSASLSGDARAVARQVAERSAEIVKAFNEEAGRSIYAEALASDSVGALNERLAQSEEAPWLRRRLVENVDLQFHQAEAFPGIGYASWDLMLRAIADDPVPTFEVHQPAGEPARVETVTPLRVRGEIQGFLILDVPLSMLTDGLAGEYSGDDALDLWQDSGRFAKAPLVELGGSGVPVLVEDKLVRIEQTPLLVAWQAGRGWTPLAGDSWILGLVVSVLGLSLAAGGFVLRRQGDRVAAESKPKDELRPVKSLKKGKPVDGDAAVARGTETDGAAPPAPPPASAQEDVAVEDEPAVDPGIFRAYDIRGVVGKTLSEGVARMIGRAIGSALIARGRDTICVGRDGRLSSESLSEALIQGLLRAGVDVVDVGQVPTGVLYFSCHHLETGSGVMVTGSHNPPDYNGFKIVLDGETLYGDSISGLYRRIAEADFTDGQGSRSVEHIEEAYIDFISTDIQLEEPIKVVADAGNGVAGELAPKVLEAIGCEVTPLFCEIDGTFPNHHPDPSQPDNLKALIETVQSEGADLGVAFDGDGDRLGVVTPQGELIYADRLLMLMAMDVLTRNPGGTVIYDVKCTGKLANIIVGHGGTPLLYKTGHSLIKAKMKETGAVLGGEMSGHFFFQERWFGFDDGIYAAARLLEILALDPRSPADALDALPKGISTPELKIEMEEGETHAFMREFQERAHFDGARVSTIDGVRADYPDGWGLVRSSNTTPILVLRFEADDEDALQRIQNEFRDQLLALRDDLSMPF